MHWKSGTHEKVLVCIPVRVSNLQLSQGATPTSSRLRVHSDDSKVVFSLFVDRSSLMKDGVFFHRHSPEVVVAIMLQISRL